MISDVTKTHNFVYRKHDTIGAVDALHDKKYLQSCFIDTGELEVLSDLKRPECIVLGRTGSGKTALLEILKFNESKVISLDIEQDLALSYLTDSKKLQHFTDIGLDLDIFFRALWRHIFLVEILKKHFDISNESKKTNFLTQIREKVVKNPIEKEAKEYILKWGDRFWENTRNNATEYMNSYELSANSSVAGKTGVSNGLVSANLESEIGNGEKFVTEERGQITKINNSAVGEDQLRKLKSVMHLLKQELLTDNQKKYYITIDKLDENWINDDLRYRLIRALIETVKDMNPELGTVKIIISLRKDQAEATFKNTKKRGDQDEKYQSLFLPIIWADSELEEVLNIRVNQLMKEQYTKEEINVRDTLPQKILNDSAIEYLIKRTLSTPRDIVTFFNICISKAAGKTMSESDILSAETIYSEQRMQALYDEWISMYPSLKYLIECLRSTNIEIGLDYFQTKIFDEFYLNFILNTEREKIVDDISQIIATDAFDQQKSRLLPLKIIQVLFTVGVLGIKKHTSGEVLWSTKGDTLSLQNLQLNTKFYIHPAFYSTLEINQSILL